MKATSSLVIASCLVALGGCSSSSSTPPPANTTTDSGAPGTDAGTIPDAIAAQDSGATNTDGDDEAGDDGGSSATEFDATLSGAEVVPATQSTATATAKFFLQADGATLTYDITQSVSSATAVNVRSGAAGSSGAIVQQLTPVSDHMTGSLTLTSDQADALSSGELYVDIDSQAMPGGEVRGQIVAPGSEIFVAVATGAQQVPSVNSAYTGAGAFILSPDQTTLTYHVSTTATPTDINLHRALSATTGPVVYPVTPIGATSDGSITLSGNDPQDLEAGHFYLNISTAANPIGELRGQIIKPGETLFTGVLLGSNEVPPVTTQATGGAQFILSPTQTSIRYEVLVNGIIPTSADIDVAPVQMNGTLLYQLTLNSTGALGTLAVQPSDVASLIGSGVYVNVHTASNASGELRTQLIRQ